MSETSFCPLCGTTEEWVIHILWDCPYAQQVWALWGESIPMNDFLLYNTYEWLRSNLKGRGSGSGGPRWNLVFGYTIWQLWKWRNECVFCGVTLNAQNIWHVVRIYIQDGDVVGMPTSLQVQNVEAIFIRWTFPWEDWIKGNVDGSVNQCDRNATCAGVFRDADGRWVHALQENYHIVIDIFSYSWFSVSKNCFYLWF